MGAKKIPARETTGPVMVTANEEVLAKIREMASRTKVIVLTPERRKKARTTTSGKT